MANFDHKEIEKKWSKSWKENNLYRTPNTNRPKKYILDMWPYPSGAGLHVGHVEGYTATDIYSRYLRMKGFDVLHPMGWDSFGLPAENYAIKTGIHPSIQTQESIKVFKEQMNSVGLSYDWEKEEDASSPEYYKHTQELFLDLFDKGLAYKAKAPVIWCPSCETVLANEQVVDDKCERCDSTVIQKQMEQWFFKITDYAQRLLDGLETIDWPASTKAMQRNWIGRKEGHTVKFDDVEVFTTRIDTLHGASFVAVANDSEEGFTGKYVTNPATGKKIPVLRADYVLDTYGTGAVMGVPAYDERDLVFAKKFDIEIIQMEPDPSMEKYGQKKIQYRLRDWLISRQRYWGTPIPMIFCDKCNWQPVTADQLPVKLPLDVDFKPTGESPIARSKTFQTGVTCPKCGGVGRREVDTMDTFVDSSWYFLKFAEADVKKWMPVDLYIGGDHATTHLIFARFINLFLNDQEPFAKFYKNGHVLGEDNRKMSKRWGNVVNPVAVVDKFGADTLRMYEMFMGPLDMTKAWNTSGVEGVYRFLNRLYRKFEETCGKTGETGAVNRLVNDLTLRVTTDLETLSFNTAIAAMMETLNQMGDVDGNWPAAWEVFAKVLAPFAPFISEEIWNRLGHKESIHIQSWPDYDPSLRVQVQVTVAIQVNGKLRDLLKDGPDIEQRAAASAKIQPYIKGANYRTIFVPGKVINFIVNV